MANCAMVLVARDGIVAAADAPPAIHGGVASDSILQLDQWRACILYEPLASSRPFLDAFLAATTPLPATVPAFMQALNLFMVAHPPGALGAGAAVFGIEPNTADVAIHEIAWTGQGPATRQIAPISLFIGLHSIPRYLNALMYGAHTSLSMAWQHAAFLVGETRLGVASLRSHFVMATIDRTTGFHWVAEPQLSEVIDSASEKSRRLTAECIGLF